jgi:HTH-type transcriptional regulator/antitoxin HigA
MINSRSLFFHEAGHLLLHGDKDLLLEGVGTISPTHEQEANQFAARTLIPPEFQSAMLDLPLNGRAAIRFAIGLGVSPGIVVGQLQKLNKIKYGQLSSLKRRCNWES